MATPPGKTAQAAVPQKNGDNGITLSGIAWQDERHLRRAVINGFLMEEGAEVQGAKIVEIMENRVKFRKGGDLFEVVHNAATVR
jgi:general secretion pathway protein B